MKLQLLVPQYKENEDVIINLLNSIAIQQGIDLNNVEVLIANDGSDIKLTKEFLDQYPFKINYYLNDHQGVSGTRQALLDWADADYVMFCDADDMFFSLIGLNVIFATLEKSLKSNRPIDILVPTFYQEVKLPNKECIYLQKGLKERDGVDGVFVHGKVYRRKYLVDNNIKWDSSLVINEDSYFNTLALMLTQNVQYCPIPYYLWKHNDNSITRSDPNWNMHNYDTFISSNKALLKQFKDRGLVAQLQLYVCQLIYNCYFTINQAPWINKENHIFYTNIMNIMKDYVQEYNTIFEEAPEELKTKIYENQKRAKTDGNDLDIKFENWYSKLK